MSEDAEVSEGREKGENVTGMTVMISGFFSILHTGGEGAFTQWVWVELIESTETICPANTHQVHAGFI